jgi:cellulose biosynthesis protein BcsQ
MTNLKNNIRFDDSLPMLVQVISDNLGKETASSGVALRDASGRLAFFSTSALDEKLIETLSTLLYEKLGTYARTDRVLAGRNDFGAEQILNDPTAYVVSINEIIIRVVDRRLVGTDWQRPPVPVALPPLRLVFASLKGGVGRSTALAVVAGDLALKGKRVLAIDLDIEAPGLGSILLDEDTLPEFGVLDALVENGISGLDESFLMDMIGPSALSKGQGRIDVAPVLGRRSLKNPADVLAKIAIAYTEDVNENGEIMTFLDQVSSLIDRFAATKNYDVILVDARAGLHETTASAVMGLGAEVFLFGRDELQTFQGFRVLLAHLARFVDNKKQKPEWLSRLTLVQGQAPQELTKRQHFQDKCNAIIVDSGLGSNDISKEEALGQISSFSNIPWDDEIPDAEVLPNEDSRIQGPVAILDDSRFRGFDPLLKRDLLSEKIYQSTFGQLLEQIYNCFPAEEENPV